MLILPIAPNSNLTSPAKSPKLGSLSNLSTRSVVFSGMPVFAGTVSLTTAAVFAVPSLLMDWLSLRVLSLISEEGT